MFLGLLWKAVDMYVSLPHYKALKVQRLSAQELQAFTLMLYKMTFCYQVKSLPYIWIITLLNLLCIQCCEVSLFLFRLTCCIFNLASKHVISLIPTYIPNHLNVETSYFS